MPKKQQTLTIFQLAMLITVSIDSIRNLPAMAIFGTTLPFFFILAAIFFLLPTGLVSAELSSSQLKQGGIYGWVKQALGQHLGLVAIWLQWINTMIWYPTILSFVAGAIAFLIDPALAMSKSYLLVTICATIWLLTLLNLYGIKTSARLASFCAIAGMILPMGLLIAFSLYYLFHGNNIVIHFTAHNTLPSLNHSQNWLSLTAIITSFLGMELATVHVNQIKNAQSHFPKAILLSIAIIVITISLGSMAIAYVIPASDIHLIDGIMQTFQYFFTAYHLTFLTPVISILIIIGGLGGMINWMISPARGLEQAAKDNYLPDFLVHENKHGVPSRILLIQATIISLICFSFYLIPSVNGSYWLLSDLSTELYLLMYLLMFFAAICLKKHIKGHTDGFQIPGGKVGFYLVCGLGILGCIVPLIVGFIPPDTIDVGGNAYYHIIFTSGLILMNLPILGCFWHKHKKG